jgi:ribonuclease P protein component
LIGVATSKKLGEKPQRNRQKRRIKAALAFSSKIESMDIVIVASGKTNQAEFATLQQECAQKIGEIERWGGE